MVRNDVLLLEGGTKMCVSSTCCWRVARSNTTDMCDTVVLFGRHLRPWGAAIRCLVRLSFGLSNYCDLSVVVSEFHGILNVALRLGTMCTPVNAWSTLFNIHCEVTLPKIVSWKETHRSAFLKRVKWSTFTLKNSGPICPKVAGSARPHMMGSHASMLSSPYKALNRSAVHESPPVSSKKVAGVESP